MIQILQSNEESLTIGVRGNDVDKFSKNSNVSYKLIDEGQNVHPRNGLKMNIFKFELIEEVPEKPETLAKLAEEIRKNNQLKKENAQLKKEIEALSQKEKE